MAASLRKLLLSEATTCSSTGKEFSRSRYVSSSPPLRLVCRLWESEPILSREKAPASCLSARLDILGVSTTEELLRSSRISSSPEEPSPSFDPLCFNASLSAERAITSVAPSSTRHSARRSSRVSLPTEVSDLVLCGNGSSRDAANRTFLASGATRCRCRRKAARSGRGETLAGEIGPPVLSPSGEGSAANRRWGRASRPPLITCARGWGRTCSFEVGRTRSCGWPSFTTHTVRYPRWTSVQGRAGDA